VNPDLVMRDEQGKPFTVRYDEVNAMLLNEFLKEHRKNEEQQRQIEALTAELKAQAAQIQKVSAQLQLNKPTLQTVSNNQYNFAARPPQRTPTGKKHKQQTTER